MDLLFFKRFKDNVVYCFILAMSLNTFSIIVKWDDDASLMLLLLLS